MYIPANVQMTDNLEIARLRLSKFVNAQAQHIVRVTGLNYEESMDAPTSYEELVAEFVNAKLFARPVRVFKGASENSIYNCEATNWAFRFWHDYLHFSRQLDFSYESEKLAALAHCAAVAAEFGLGSLEYKLMEIDTVGQLEYFEKNGDFVPDQLEFAKAQLAA